MNLTPKDIMTLDYFNDFYVLEGLSAIVSQKCHGGAEFRHSVARFISDLQEYQKEFVTDIAKRTFVYLWAACLGEARHARASVARNIMVHGWNKHHRSDVFAEATQYPPTPHNLKALISVFKQPWRGSFGGKAWLNIAEACAMYGKISDVAFLDHVIDLEHNNGTVFSKDDGKYTIGFQTTYDGSFGDLLDFKFSHNIVEKYHPARITRKTRRLLDRAVNVLGIKNPHWLEASLLTLDKYRLSWGDKILLTEQKWLEWADCSRGNKPHHRPMYYAYARRYNFQVTKMTHKQLTDYMHMIGGKIKEHVRDARRVDIYIRSKIHMFAPHCKFERQRTLYEVLPVKVKAHHWNSHRPTVIQVPIPYYGVGRETDYGFVLSLYASEKHTTRANERGYDGSRGYETGFLTKHNGNVYAVVSGYNISVAPNCNGLEAILE